MMNISFPNEFGNMSGSSCSQEMCFYSAPTSPSRLKLRPSCGYQTCPTTPRAYEDDANSNLDEFEFETSHRFNLCDMDIEINQKGVNTFDHQQRVCEDSFPAMAFADELFSDGKVLPLLQPLKLPPRLLQNGDGNMVSTQSSRMASPRSPGLVLRLPFSRHSLWDDDFDPFMVALEKVKEEKRGRPKAKHGLRRTRSLSPFRSSNKSEKHVGQSQPNQPKSHCYEVQKEPLKQASRRVNMLSEPKGLVFTRQVRQIGEGNGRNFEAKITSVSKLDRETKKDESERGGFWTRNKKGKIKKFLFGIGKMGKASAQQYKLEDKKAAPENPPVLRKLDMKSVASTQSTQWNKDEATSELSKMRLVCHRPMPRFFLCLGYE